MDREQHALWVALGEWMFLLENKKGRHAVSIHRHYVRDLELCRTLYASN